MGEESNLSCRRIPTNLCTVLSRRQSMIPHSLSVAVHSDFFQTVQCGVKGESLYSGEIGQTLFQPGDQGQHQ